MHLQAVFILVDILGHPVELSGLVQICCRSRVDWKVAQWCAVVCALCQSRLLKVEVVRWAEEEDTLAVLSVSTSELAITGISQTGENNLVEAIVKRRQQHQTTHALLTSQDLYAYAAAGPEYEKPACLRVCISTADIIIDHTHILRSDDDPGARHRQLVHLPAFSVWSDTCHRRLHVVEPAVELRIQLRFGGCVPRAGVRGITNDLFARHFVFDMR